MNQSALDQIVSHWPELIKTVRWLTPSQPTVHQAWRSCVISTSLPALYLAQSSENRVPVMMASLYKAILGYSQVLTYLLLAAEGVADTPLNQLGEPKEFSAWLDQEEWLIGDLQVCAGSSRMIEVLFQSLRSGQREDDTPSSPPSWWHFPDPTSLFWENIMADVGILTAQMIQAQQNDLAQVLCSDEDQRLLDHPPLPLLHAITATPNRSPKDAFRLFPHGHLPAKLIEFFGLDIL